MDNNEASYRVGRILALKYIDPLISINYEYVTFHAKRYFKQNLDKELDMSRFSGIMWMTLVQSSWDPKCEIKVTMTTIRSQLFSTDYKLTYLEHKRYLVLQITWKMEEHPQTRTHGLSLKLGLAFSLQPVRTWRYQPYNHRN